ncbi:type IV toxin-antitoxin system AbiEi family antitoxin domain-containing protein [Cellulomonas fimi]|uniref:AbiEi antitoxin N-terminal domain-containing protein n=1 Tax=Cellulomonas fimi (strain ATCC 484 / DSM 20113 / JCM 1341 / CCUG 24087 / LMG 16345 / NBRC 15513 / NCIMB 8980 / NCTC 7547 / NRS-133) TaxID=590998 RepID=F4H694_CELFA|nr:type IV toxin-antitoxin system AbiEi family antitoxin domain-containing protein [Cellulomonas fimi]AEE44406.1 hypothetical protein Celf_0261 [Cellulomonas fimi ATCC 484]NNH08298.1 type IV toxin-antitoxin system AbiEi family antitoxin domain-containing protein [Cellulomonas fimi]VEH26298.1 Uncharacterised protein [Cellulomonas fimi]
MRPPFVVPRDLLVLASRQGGLVSTAQADRAGVDGRRRATLVRAGTWVRVTRGVYDAGTVMVVDPDERRRRAAWLGMLAYGPDAVAVGACALALHGVAGLPPVITPQVALPGGRHAPGRGGIAVRCYGQTVPFASGRYGAGRVAALPAALVQAVPELPVRHGVAVLDDVLRRGLLSPQAVAAVRRSTGRRRGVRRVRPVWDLVDPRAESPLESFARLDCVMAGLAPDELQVVIRSSDSGRVLGRGDLGWDLGGGRWLIAEIDGRAVHEAPAALLQDRRRQNALLGTGRVEMLRFTAADLGPSGGLVATVRAHLQARGRDLRPPPSLAPRTG